MMRPRGRDPAGDAGSRDRKAEHIGLALESRMQVETNAFDGLTLGHRALPEIDFEQVDTATTFLGRELAAPLLISCMTGGTDQAADINRRLATAAEECRVALGVGSQRKALEDPDQAASFEVRRYAPSVPVLANLGAVQLNYGFGVDQCRAAVEMVGADALVLHLNPLQEAIQPEGDLRFGRLLPKIAAVVEGLEMPVVAKEVGSGIDARVGRQLADVGVRILDTAGVGGTSWARIEAARAEDLPLGELFADWGLTTVESIRQLAGLPEVEVIGSGGVRHGLDAAKALALGASMVGMAAPYLRAAMASTDAVAEKLRRTAHELRIAMFCTGCRDLRALQALDVLEAGRS